MALGIYIHIPFCLKKCDYCSFTSFTLKIIPQKNYTNSVINEIQLITSMLYEKKEPCSSIYFGGGTPSIISAENISRMINTINNLYELTINAEVTVEVNPKTADYEKLRALKYAGVNRISIGAQSFNDTMLKTLGRIHNAKEGMDIYKNARKAGFDNISMDIIFGMPNQSRKELVADLSKLIKLAPEHISAYILTVEEDTPIFEKANRNEITLPKDEAIADMFNLVEETLAKASYKHYEISNYAQMGKESAHNLNYWRYGEYLGFGVSAHSLIKKNGERFLNAMKRPFSDCKAVRYSNILDYKEYIKNLKSGKLAIATVEALEKKERMTEFLIMGLRMLDGIKHEDFGKEFSCGIMDIYIAQIKPLIDNDLLEIKNNSLKLTKKGVLLSNEVLVNLI